MRMQRETIVTKTVLRCLKSLKRRYSSAIEADGCRDDTDSDSELVSYKKDASMMMMMAILCLETMVL